MSRCPFFLFQIFHGLDVSWELVVGAKRVNLDAPRTHLGPRADVFQPPLTVEELEKRTKHNAKEEVKKQTKTLNALDEDF